MLRSRRFLLCLMMLALPLQGFAAAAMLYCGTGANHAATQTQLDTPTSRHHAEAAVAQHDHHSQSIDAVPQTDLPSDQAQTQLPNASHKCGVCASCCGVLAITDVPRTIAVAPLPPSDLAEPFIRIYTVPLRQAEKPPRV